MILTANSTNCHKCGKANPKNGVFCLYCGATTSAQSLASEHDPYLGQTIDNTFVVESILGEGSMGVVYKAKHRALNTYVALKILRHDFLNNRVVLTRFQREAQAASSLQHPNVVGILHYGKTFLQAPYIAMECLEGQDLSDVVVNEFPLAPERSCKILIQVCQALEAAHAAGIIHRDLKPANISIIKQRSEELVKVLDFGVAKLEGNDGEGLTRDGAICGTPAFMSPEQVMGQPVSAASDIFSLGSVCYFMLAGKLPFSGSNSVDMAGSILSFQPPPPSRARLDAVVSPELEAICMRALEKSQQNRFASALEMRLALENALELIKLSPRSTKKQGIVVGQRNNAEIDLSGDTVCEIPVMTDALESAIPENIGFSDAPSQRPSFIATSLGISDFGLNKANSHKSDRKQARLRLIFVAIIIICICLLAVLTTWLFLQLNKDEKPSRRTPTPTAKETKPQESTLIPIELAPLIAPEHEVVIDHVLQGTGVGLLLGIADSRDLTVAPAAPPVVENTAIPTTQPEVTAKPTANTKTTAKPKPSPNKKSTAKPKPGTNKKPTTAPKPSNVAAPPSALFEEAQKLEKSGNRAEACKKYRQALSNAPSADKLKIQLKVRACAKDKL